MKLWLAMAACLVLLGCAAPQGPQASDELVRAKAYREPGPASITLITVVSNRNGSGAHTALMINGSQRVIFDPAGSFQNERVPEQRDVLFGVTPAVWQGYRSAHARAAFHVKTQTINVTPEQAEAALALARANGAVGQAFCASASSGLLAQVPGFEDIDQTFFPNNLSRQFGARANVQTDTYFEDDEGTIQDGVAGIVIPD